MEALRNRMSEENRNVQTFFEPALTYDRALKWLSTEYPRCARQGTIENIGDKYYPTSYGRSKYPGRQFLTLDSEYTRVLIAITIIVAIPLEKDQKWHETGAMLDTPDMEGAKHVMRKMLALMEQQSGANVRHAEINIFMGSDLLRCKYNESTLKPTITPVPIKASEESRLVNKAMVTQSYSSPELAHGQFLPGWFEGLITTLTIWNPGATIWDEGELPFRVGGSPYSYATRLLVARDYVPSNEGVESEIYRLKRPGEDIDHNPVTLLRNPNPSKDPGGIVYILLAVAISDTILWPEHDAFLGTAAMDAASSALLEYIRTLNKNGRVQRCLAEVAMGMDTFRYSFIGDKFSGKSVTFNIPEITYNETEHIKGFNITLQKQRKHELFESESHFQAIKQRMQQRQMQDPERYRMLQPIIATQTAIHLMEINFPGKTISEENFTMTTDGRTVTNSEVKLIVVREPSKEKHNIVAVTYVVLRAGGGDFLVATNTNWLKSQEMKDAEVALLELLKSWHKEGKISDEDCRAQVSISTDAMIYRFADGERFEDYSDERQKQWKWE